MAKNIRKIVFTGGPGGGKSSIVPHAKKHLEKLGWEVLMLPEMPTLFNESNAGPAKVIVSPQTAMGFQRGVMAMQLEFEDAMRILAEDMTGPSENIALICDRGVGDQLAYMAEADFETLLGEKGIGSVGDAKMRYDAVIHMVTAADGAEEFYVNREKDPTAPRSETIEEAKALDEKTKLAWLGHPHHTIVDNSTDFPGKIHRALVALSGFLGIPEPFEIERKFFIEQPSLEVLSGPMFREFLIFQHYLKNDQLDSEERVRMETGEGGVRYSHTIKHGAGLKRVEIEVDKTFQAYKTLRQQEDHSICPIIKTRYRMLHENQIIEIDIYPGWGDKAIMEVELQREDQSVVLPDFINVIKEVTHDPAFSNHALARTRMQIPV